MMKHVISLILITLFIACSVEPKPIEYGTDTCHYCRMTIVDKIHGAEMVTDKGKVFKFDAAECLFNYKSDLESSEGYLFLTNTYDQPSELVMMDEAHYLISEELPSPMGAFLTAFDSKDQLNKVHNDKGGKIYSFSELEQKYTK